MSESGQTFTDQVDYVSGRTRLFGIVGHPIEQVRSPEMFTAEFRRRGLDAILVPLHVLPGRLRRVAAAAAALRNLDGLIFTIPYKARACASRSRSARLSRRASSVRSMRLRAKAPGWHGDIFDGMGCVEAFRRRRISFRDRSIMLLGAGGAGSAIGVAIAYEKPRAIVIHDVDARRAESLAATIRALRPGRRQDRCADGRRHRHPAERDTGRHARRCAPAARRRFAAARPDRVRCHRQAGDDAAARARRTLRVHDRSRPRNDAGPDRAHRRFFSGGRLKGASESTARPAARRAAQADRSADAAAYCSAQNLRRPAGVPSLVLR